ncbi:MAG: hypothetical protein ACI4J1_03720 [Ruminiclostridium sp.]
MSTTKIEIIGKANNIDNPSDKAIVFKVTGGLEKLTCAYGKPDSDDYAFKHILLNGKPIVQGYCPAECPTCQGLLAAGYGTDNIDCKELDTVRSCLNGEYANPEKAFEVLIPFLNLLEDGFYAFADIEYYPTDGNGRFFYSVPNKLTKNPAVCECYYNDYFSDVTDCFPLFLYPTQSTDAINPRRVEYYIDLLKNNGNVQGFAYHQYGFISALLDGHHKATAAAMLGRKIRCLTVIPRSGYFCSNFDTQTAEKLYFCNYEYTPKEPINKDLIFHRSNSFSANKISNYNLINADFSDLNRKASFYYPTVTGISDMAELELCPDKIDDNSVSEWIDNPTEENCLRLKYFIKLLLTDNPEKACEIAQKIFCGNNPSLPIGYSREMLDFIKSEHLI